MISDDRGARPESEIIAFALEILESVLPALVLDPAFTFSFGKPETYSASSHRFGGEYRVVRVPLQTNRRAQLLACTQDRVARSGPHRNYLAGLLDGALTASFGEDIAQSYSFWLDISCSDASSETVGPRTMPLSEALRAGILTDESPLTKILREYACPALLVDGSSIPGPNPDVLRAVDSIFRERTPRSVCEMFAGTGLIGKMCVRAGASVDYVDLFCGAIRSNTADLPSDRVRIFELDAFQFRSQRLYDLLILDPYYELALDAATIIIPSMKPFCQSIVFDVGIRADVYWSGLVIDRLREVLGHVNINEYGESTIAIWP